MQVDALEHTTIQRHESATAPEVATSIQSHRLSRSNSASSLDSLSFHSANSALSDHEDTDVDLLHAARNFFESSAPPNLRELSADEQVRAARTVEAMALIGHTVREIRRPLLAEKISLEAIDLVFGTHRAESAADAVAVREGQKHLQHLFSYTVGDISDTELLSRLPHATQPPARSPESLAYRMLTTKAGQAVAWPLYKRVIAAHKLDQTQPLEDAPEFSRVKQEFWYEMFPALGDQAIRLHQGALS